MHLTPTSLSLAASSTVSCVDFDSLALVSNKCTKAPGALSVNSVAAHRTSTRLGGTLGHWLACLWADRTTVLSAASCGLEHETASPRSAHSALSAGVSLVDIRPLTRCSSSALSPSLPALSSCAPAILLSPQSSRA